MAGHSKWANIKRTEAVVDAKRGKIFSKLGREIIVAARLGGGNPDANPRLRAVMAKAREANMPMDSIQRAIQKAVGGLEGADYEELYYEGYGPGGVAIIAQALTDNRNRTAGDVRFIFSKHGGNLGETGCVGWMFTKSGLIIIERETVADEDELLMAALEAGAQDLRSEDPQVYEIITDPGRLDEVRNSLLAKGYRLAHAEVTMLPQNTVSVSSEDAARLVKLIDFLEDHDDIQHVYTNLSEE